MTRPLVLMILVTLVTIAPGCGARRLGPYQPMDEAARDPRRADRLNAQAAVVISSDAPKAERLLRESLTADLYHGPSHNNLGVLFLRQGRLYEAAAEFEWARKLMPNHADPRMNLALTLEKAGHTDEALAAYAAALDVSPEHVPTMQALARLQVRSGKTEERTRELLPVIATRGETEAWRDWARRQMIRLER